MTWIVTGASRGLGRHLALLLAERGHDVLACARDLPRLHALAQQGAVGRITPCQLDLAESATLGARLAEAVQAMPHISGAINNAGIGWHKPFVEHTQAELMATLQVNLMAVMQICHVLVPRLVAQRRGHIVNIGSDLARRPLANMAAYVASKHGLAGFSHSLLREVKQHGVKVSLVNPGIIDTDFGGSSEGSRDAAWSLRPAHLAQLVVQLIEQPGNLLIDELTVHPLGQGEF